HAYSNSDFTFTGRQGVLSELIWDNNSGWPAFKYGSTPPAQGESPIKVAQKQNLNVSANFEKEEKQIPWVWDVSQPRPEFKINNGYLQFIVSTASTPIGSFLGLVIKKGTYTFSAECLPQAKVLQCVCVYGDSKNALGFGVSKDSLEIWQVKDGKRKVVQKRPLPESKSPITLTLASSKGKFYQFSWKNKNGKTNTIDEVRLDGTFLPRWDRAPRVGISVRGEDKTPGMIGAVNLQYE
ncbi:MAG: glycoside hydrolase, partial [Bacteroidota bacterium]|nr:glycoside hydrolase [Bacteroidota bacterium]